MSLDPSLLSAPENLARLYFLQGRTAEAEEFFAKVYRSKRHNPYHQYNKALLLLEAGQITQAEKRLRRAIRLMPTEKQFHLARARARNSRYLDKHAQKRPRASSRRHLSRY